MNCTMHDMTIGFYSCDFILISLQFCTQRPIVRTLDTTHSYMIMDPYAIEIAEAINHD